MLANLVKQKVTSSGTGDLELGTVISGFIDVASVFSDGDKLFYSIIDGNYREVGQGTYVAAGTKITRDYAFEILDSGGYNPSPAAARLSTSFSAVVSVSPSIQALTTHLASWKRMYSNPMVKSGIYTEPPFSALVGAVEIPYFSASIEQSLPVSFPIGHDIEPSTNIWLGVHWAPNDNDVGTVRWGIEILMAEPNGSFASSGTQYVDTVVSGNSDKYLISEFPTELTIPTPDTMIMSRIFRDSTHGNDTYPGVAGLLQVSGAYQATRVGTPSKNSDHYVWS